MSAENGNSRGPMSSEKILNSITTGGWAGERLMLTAQQIEELAATIGIAPDDRNKWQEFEDRISRLFTDHVELGYEIIEAFPTPKNKIPNPTTQIQNHMRSIGKKAGALRKLIENIPPTAKEIVSGIAWKNGQTLLTEMLVDNLFYLEILGNYILSNKRGTDHTYRRLIISRLWCIYTQLTGKKHHKNPRGKKGNGSTKFLPFVKLFFRCFPKVILRKFLINPDLLTDSVSDFLDSLPA